MEGETDGMTDREAGAAKEQEPWKDLSRQTRRRRAYLPWWFQQIELLGT